MRAKINAQSIVTDGRTLPDDEALAIGSGRRMNVAILFLDICGSSQRPSYTEEEQLINLRVLNLFFSEMIKIVEDYGGFVEKNTGDGLLAYFEDNGGDPPETAVKRAVTCGLTMMATNDYYIKTILQNSRIEPLKFRLSIEYGPVTIGRLGAARRFNSIVAIGNAANFASKMLSKAKAGDILLGATAKDKLPVDWQYRYTELAVLFTGWTYRINGLPYPLYRYTGRWARLL
jgi:class 3 adenylate cyclase